MEKQALLTFEEFLKGFHLIKEVFEFTSSEIYIDAVYEALKDKLTDRLFIENCNGVLKDTSKEEWNKLYGFKGRPAIKDWTDAFIPKPVAKTRSFKNPNTGGMQTETYYDYPDYYLAEINQQKQGKLEQETAIKKENRLDYLPKLKTF